MKTSDSRPTEAEWTAVDFLCVIGLVTFVFAIWKGWL